MLFEKIIVFIIEAYYDKFVSVEIYFFAFTYPFLSILKKRTILKYWSFNKKCFKLDVNVIVSHFYPSKAYFF